MVEYKEVLDALRLYWDANWDWWIRMLPGNLFLIAFPSRDLARRALSQEFMHVGRTTVQLLEWWPDCATFPLGTLRQWIGISGLPVHCWGSTS